MLLDRLYDDGLAQASYLLACERERVGIVIDPNRDVDQYVEAAARAKVSITHVTETHIHADFLSGARALATATGARLLLSGEGRDPWRYDDDFAAASGACLLRDGDWIDVGQLRIGVRHTPGHTPEHVCFLVIDGSRGIQPVGMFTGDFIFVGDVGRPDLLERAANERGTMHAFAAQLFASLRATRDLPDYLQLWPGHGAGSACGKALGSAPFTTLGYERLVNWALQFGDEARFVDAVLDEQPEPPAYFAMMKYLNRLGGAVDGVPHATQPPALDLAALEHAMSAGAAIIDVRPTAEFAEGHVPGSLNIPAGTSFVTWAGWLVRYDQDIVLLGDDAWRTASARRDLALIGMDRVVGRAGASVRDAWSRAHGSLQAVSRVPIAELEPADERLIVDVRNASEWRSGHVPAAVHCYLGSLTAWGRNMSRDTPIAVYCQGGTRSAIAASLLQAAGFTNVVNLSGGVDAWTASGRALIR